MRIRWVAFILILLLFTVVLWASASTALRPLESFTTAASKTFDFDTANASQQMETCSVYYTSNIDICKRGYPTEPITDEIIDGNSVNYYMMGSNEINIHIRRLETTATRTPIQNDTLRDLKRALSDIDTFPFENTCKMDMYGFNEVRSHPYKINTPYDQERRGDPLHWAFCFYPESLSRTADATASNEAIRQSPEFKKVFQDSTVDLLASNASGSAPTRHRRYDMRSLYNDDLLNLHCLLYKNSAISGGNSVNTYNDTRLIEITLPSSILPTTGRISIQRMRMVRIKDAQLFIENDFSQIKKGFLALTEVVRTQDSFIQRIKNYSPSVYKMLFHLCDSTRTETASGSTSMEMELAHNKMLQLIIPKQSSFTLPNFLKSKNGNEQTIYNFYTQRPFGDISDMRFNITHIDGCITPNDAGTLRSANPENLNCVNSV